MRLVTVVKTPLRAARALYRGVRDVVRPAEPAAAAPPAPAPQAPPPPPAPAPRRDVHVDVEPTPNPHARKFTCSVTVVPSGSLAFDGAAAAERHPVGRALFALPGVKTVFAVRDFVTVTRAPDTSWDVLEPRIVAALQEVLG